MKATDELRAAWEAHFDTPMPRPTGVYAEDGVRPDAVLDEAFGDLAPYDGLVAEVVWSVLGVTGDPFVEDIEPATELRARVEGRAAASDATVAADARAMLAYIDQVHDLLALAQRTHAATRPRSTRR